jgi:hypothetical protein
MLFVVGEKMKSEHTNKIKAIIPFFLMLFFALAVDSSFAQAMCDIKTFRLDKVKGKVISNAPKGYEPIPQAKVELWRISKADEDDSLITSIVSDENGLFEIGSIKRGLYRLEVSKYESGFMRHSSAIKIVRESGKGKLLMIRLGVSQSWEGCGDATLIKN